MSVFRKKCSKVDKKWAIMMLPTFPKQILPVDHGTILQRAEFSTRIPCKGSDQCTGDEAGSAHEEEQSEKVKDLKQKQKSETES